MKRIKIMFICLLTGFMVTSTFAQRFIRTDTELKANSDLWQVSRKGISAIGKYQFGPYKVVSGRAGWAKENFKRGIFSDDVKITFEQKKSFVFVSNETDTINVNSSLSVLSEMTDKNPLVFRKLFGWHDYEVKQSKETFMASFDIKNDSTAWSLVLVYPVPMQDEYDMPIWDMKTEFYGILTNGLINIEIKRVFEQENGKTSILNPIFGYEFFQDGKSIAALQDIPIHKMFVWIRKDLDENLKLIISAGISAILIGKE